MTRLVVLTSLVLSVLLMTSTLAPGAPSLRELERRLREGERFDQAGAIMDLRRIGTDEAVEVLARAYPDVSTRVRSRIVDALGEIGSAAALKSLIALLDRDLLDADSIDLFTTIKTLGERGDDSAVPFLTRVFPKVGMYQRQKIMEALSRIGSDVALKGALGLLETADEVDVRIIMEGLGGFGPKAVSAAPRLLDIVRAKTRTASVRAAAIRSLVPIADLGTKRGRELRDTLWRILANRGEHDDVRSAGLDAFAEVAIGAHRAPTIQAILEEGSDSLVKPAIRCVTRLLGEVRPESLAPSVRLALAAEPASVRRKAAEGFSRRGFARLWPVARILLRDSDAKCRRRICAMIGSLGEGAVAAKPDLLGRLEDTSPEVRLEALRALSSVGASGPGHTARLSRLLADPSLEVRVDALRALARVGPEAAGAAPTLIEFVLKKRGVERWLAITGLGNIGPAASQAVDALVTALADPTPRVRWNSAEALGRIRSKETVAVPALVRSLKDDEALVREMAAFALAEFGPKARSAIPALEACLMDDDPGVQGAVAEALEKIRGEGD